MNFKDSSLPVVPDGLNQGIVIYRDKTCGQRRYEMLAIERECPALRTPVDQILKEVEAVTRTQEQIKSELSGDLWHRQTVWNQKRDLYAELLKTTNQLITKRSLLRGQVDIAINGPPNEDKTQAARDSWATAKEITALRTTLGQGLILSRMLTFEPKQGERLLKP